MFICSSQNCLWELNQIQHRVTLQGVGYFKGEIAIRELVMN